MKCCRKELQFITKTRRAFISIAPQVEAALAESSIREGLCLMNAMTCGKHVHQRQREQSAP